MPADTGSVHRNSVILGAFCLVVALLLAAIYGLTQERIEQQLLAAERQALNAVFPAALHTNDLLADVVPLNPAMPETCQCALLDTLELSVPRMAYLARRDGEFTGIILPVYAHDGYSGDIQLLVGILADGSVTGVRVLLHQETPGLGDKIDIRVSDWITQFNGVAFAAGDTARWQIVKDGGEFDQLVGATVTSRAMVDAVHRAVLFYEQNRNRFSQYAE